MQAKPSSDLPTLHAALRAHTAHTHQRLDDIVGSFDTAEQYGAFVASSFRFRHVAEQACAGCELWSPQVLVSDLAQDLQDLGLRSAFPAKTVLDLATTSAKLGGLYVLEGSSLGARLLLRRAEGLGFSATHGARHLAHQSGDLSRWKAFLTVLDRDDIDHAAALAGAQNMFDYALGVYSEKTHEFA